MRDSRAKRTSRCAGFSRQSLEVSQEVAKKVKLVLALLLRPRDPQLACTL
jgi:hypothetical protein